MSPPFYDAPQTGGLDGIRLFASETLRVHVAFGVLPRLLSFASRKELMPYTDSKLIRINAARRLHPELTNNDSFIL